MAEPVDSNLQVALETAVQKLDLLPGETLTLKRMFGGLCYLLNGKMLGGIAGRRLVVRLEEDEFEAASARGEVKPMDFTGRPLRNFAYAEPSSFATEEQLLEWLETSLQYVRKHMLK